MSQQGIAFIEVSLAASNPHHMSSGVEALKICHIFGYRTVVVAQNPSFYGSLLHSFVDEWITCDTRNAQAIAQALNHLPVVAVLTFSDLFVGIAAHVAHLLGLAGTAIDSPAIQRDKAAIRQALDQVNLPNPRWAVVDLSETVHTSPLGYPCIVKPVDGSASWDVRRVVNDDELQAAVQAHLARRDYGRNTRPKYRFLFEEELIGPLFSAEGFSLRGQACIWGYSDRLLINAPFFVEASSTFSGYIPQQTVPDFVQAVLHAVNYTFGPFHLEFILTNQGPLLVEFNPRLIGGNAHTCINLCCDANVITFILHSYIGANPPPLHPSRASTLRDIYVERTGMIEAIQGVDSANSAPGVVEVLLRVQSGDTVRYATSNSDSLGYIITMGQTPCVSFKYAEHALQLLKIQLH